MIKKIEEAEKTAALNTANMMLSAAKTAPKGSGKDTVTGMILTDTDMMALADEMEKAGEEYNLPFFVRDANNIRACHAVVLLGAHSKPFGLEHCGMCGFGNCSGMIKAGGNCAFNITDLGIAAGSAVSIAADNRIDNRIMYSAGRAAVRMGLFPEDITIAYGIPLYTGEKSILFDRNPGAVML